MSERATERERLTDEELDSFYAYAERNMRGPTGDRRRWADYTVRLIEEVRRLRSPGDRERPLDFPPESEVPDDLFGVILHSAWILTFARSCEWKDVRAEIDQLAKEVRRLRASADAVRPEAGGEDDTP